MALDAPIYPVGLILAGRRCLVVGGGGVARRKVEGLLAAGAAVTVVAPEVAADLATMPVTVLRRRYARGDTAGFSLVVTATGDPDVDRAVFEDAEAQGTFVNAADNVASCSFILPAVARRGDVTLATAIRDELARHLPERVELLASLVGEARERLHAAGRSTESIDWRPVLGEGVRRLVADGRVDEARSEIHRLVDLPEPDASARAVDELRRPGE